MASRGITKIRVTSRLAGRVPLLRPMDDQLDRRDFDRLYANYLEVGHSAFEFLLDFGSRRPGGAIHFNSGIVTSPGCAQAFLEVLDEAIQKYRKLHGPIPGPEPLPEKDA